MEPAASSPLPRRFGAFELDFHACQLRKDGRRIRLQEHSLRVLATLLERPGDVVSREDLCSRLWPDGTIVDFENGLNVAVGKLRQALADSAENPRYIETVPRQGYRFIAQVEVPPPRLVQEEPPAPLPPQAARTHVGYPHLAVAASLVFVLLAAGYLGVRRARSHAAAIPQKPILMILPFQDYDPGGEQQYLADGLTEEMTTQLSRLEPNRLDVIARTTATQYRQAARSIADMRRDLGVAYLLEGSIRRSAGRVRVTAQLIRATDQGHVWAAEYDRSLGDVLTMEAEIAQAVADRISLALSPETKDRLGNVRAVNPKAYDAYLRGRYLLSDPEESPESVAKAGSYFESAIQADPGYAAPYAGLAEYSLILSEVTHAGADESFRKAKELAAKAVALDESLPEGHMMLAAHATFTRDWRTAAIEFDRTLQLDPNLVRARALHSAYLLAIGHPDDALAEIRRAQQLDPLSLGHRGLTQRTLYLTRRYDEAIGECRKRLELKPGSAGTANYLAMSYAHTGRYAEALELAQSGRLAPAVAGYIYAVTGRPGEARRIIERLTESAARDFEAPYGIAVIYAGLGEKEPALTWLERSNAAHDPTLSNRLLVDPKLDGLRAESRFRELVSQMKYPR